MTAQGSNAKATGFFAHEEDDIDGAFRREAVFLQALYRFDNGENAGHAIKLTTAGHAVRMGPDEDRRRICIRALLMSDNISEGVYL